MREIGKAGRGAAYISSRSSRVRPTCRSPWSKATLSPRWSRRRSNWIQDEHGHGSAVIIPAFNNFEHKQVVAGGGVPGGGLQLLPGDPRRTAGGRGGGRGRERRAGREHVAGGACSVSRRDTLRADRCAFLSGRKANERVRDPRQRQSRTRSRRRREGWRFDYCVENPGRRSVGLCRNGMWITEELPMFQNAFADRQPFQALILLSSDARGCVLRTDPRGRDAAPRQARAEADGPGSAEGRCGTTLREIRERESPNWSPRRLKTSTVPRTSCPSSWTKSRGRDDGGRQPSFWGQVGTTGRSTMVRRKGWEARPWRTRTRRWRRAAGRNRTGRIVVERIFRIASVLTGEGQADRACGMYGGL